MAPERVVHMLLARTSYRTAGQPRRTQALDGKGDTQRRTPCPGRITHEGLRAHKQLATLDDPGVHCEEEIAV